MNQRILLMLAVALLSPADAFAQLNFEENKKLDELLKEPETKVAIEKRLKLIEGALDREADPKMRFSGAFYALDLKRARIPAADGVPFLLKRLEHDSETARRSAVRLLGAYGAQARAATPTLLQRLTAESSKAARSDTMFALARIDPTDAKSVEAILAQLGADEKDDAINAMALQALALMASAVPKSEMPRIKKYLEHRSTMLGMHAHELLGKMVGLKRPTLEELKNIKAIEWRQSDDEGYAVLASIAAAGTKAEFAVPLLVDLLDFSPPPYLECIALETLAKTRTGNPKAIAALIERLAAAKDIQVRFRARPALSQFDLKQPESVRAMAAGLRHKDRNVRLDVATVLRTWDEPGRLPADAHAEMLEPLLETLSEADDSVFPSHLDAYFQLLRRFGPQAAPAGDAVVRLYKSGTYFKKYGDMMRGKMLAVLANVGVPPSGHELVMDALKKGPTNANGIDMTYAAAARAAATFADAKEAVPLLLPGLVIKEPEKAIYFIDWSGNGQGKPTTVRLETLRALAKFGAAADASLGQIEKIADTKPSPQAYLEFLVYQEARRAYAAIKGAPLPPVTGIFADGKTESLHLDERLEIKMVLKVRTPRPRDVLNRLEKETKLKFTTDENVDPNTPVWGSLYATGMPAFTVMRQMAAAPSIQGKWEEVEGGYRLIGKKWTAQEMAAKVTKFPAPPFRDDSFDPLPEDKRLQKTLNVQMNDARVGDIVQRIQAATGVALIVENVDLETPLYGSINFPNVMAWSMMRNLAEHQRIQGSWEKNGEGYRLRGTRPPQPVVAVAPPIGVNPMPAKTDVAAPTPPRTSLYICFGVFSTITIGAIVAIAIWLIGRKNLTAEA